MKVVAIVQARMGSTRLPNKVMKSICGTPMIEVLLKRLSASKEVNEIIVATSSNDINQPLIDHVEGLGYICSKGSENNVLSRYFKTAKDYSADVVVRITGDCPLVDPDLVDDAINKFKSLNIDYLCNNYPPTYPDGLDIEVCSFKALKQANDEAFSSFDKEHVTSYLRNEDKFKTFVYKNIQDLSKHRWTVDESADFELIQNIFQYFHPRIDFSWQEVIKLYSNKPQLFEINKYIQRNEGALMGKGQKLWKRAKEIIPGGNMLLSKRSEMFLPDQWPSYFIKSKGCEVWDMDNNKFIDMSIMGIGTNILGYGHPLVDEAVNKTISNGNMSTLNCPEEVYLSEKLVELHPWADMVKLARSGGEANAVAIRIARAASGKDNVAICGYHGWHDWYLSVNLSNEDSLEGHLLPGLEPNGVPKNLKDTVFPFNYNNYDELESLVKSRNIGVIKMEVSRGTEPKDNFLKRVRELATNNNIVLIFDECTSGFRETYGGLHKKYDVEPDMAMFGKALGNGYAITATIGKKDIMEAAQSSFISSTFWTERIGPSAALATLKVMEEMKSWELITETGLAIRSGWQKLADNHNLEINHWGIPALTGFTFKSKNTNSYKTLITQEMLNKGYLASNNVYACINHTPDVLDKFFNALDPIMKLIKSCEEGKKDISKLLKGSVCHDGFKRLN